MMKKDKVITPGYIVFIIILMVIGGAIAYGVSNIIRMNNYEKVNIGDTCVKQSIYDENNPFEEIKYDTIIIVDIKNKYVKYRYYGQDSTYTYSLHESAICKDIIKKW